ncbi:unnamed protein product [Rotaria sp. Silwood2]|nr:unnamed protein product [Rotaria sp. Silwood2]
MCNTTEKCDENNNHVWYFGKSSRAPDGYIFRCRRCRGTKSIRVGTFFEQSHLPLSAIFEIMYYWSREEDSIKQIMHEAEVGSNTTVVDWKNFCRDICAEYFLRNPAQIGGLWNHLS